MKETFIGHIRHGMMHIARILNKFTHGKIRPAHITALSLIGHLPVAWALIEGEPILAAILLAVFSLLDALDGALSRVQHSSSLSGMYFDAVSDRIKEVIVYSALIIYTNEFVDTSLSWVVVAVAGTSILVSYTKAKGEMALSSTEKDPQKLNRILSGGIASYEVRITALVIALLFGWLIYILPILLIINSITIVTRFYKVTKALQVIDTKAAKL